MTKFFATTNGTYYPIARIRRIASRVTTPENGLNYVEVLLDSEEIVRVAQYDIRKIMEQPSHVVPAASGTFFLGSVEANDEDISAVWKTQIIAWAIDEEGTVTPYTPDGANDSLSDIQPILMPDGSVIIQGDRAWKNVDDWFSEAKRAALEKAADKAVASEK